MFDSSTLSRCIALGRAGRDTIVSRERDGRKFWIRVGSAFKNRDGSLNVVLDASPVNGTLHIRPARTSDAEGGNVLDREEG